MISFLDLKKINDQYTEELKQEAIRVIDSGRYLLGERVRQFEKNLADYIGVKYAIAVANGLDALRLILRAYLELKEMHEGDEIIVPANTFIASILAITENRLKPVLVDPDINTYNLDLSLIEKHITNRSRAIMVVHLYGRSCWGKEIENLIEKYHLIIIEDNAQSIGAVYNGKKTGSLGNAAGFSFYPAKNLGALGDSGAVTTNDGQLAEIIRALGNYGSKTKYLCDYLGFNSRMDEMQAAFLTVKLKYIDTENQRRREIAQQYINNISSPEIILPIVDNMHITQNDYGNAWHLFPILCKNRDKLQQYLYDRGIQTLIHYPIPPHKQKAFSHYSNLHFPITERIHDEELSLPISPVMENWEIEKVIESLNEFQL
jgi:dTDP-4-amino-4,6-dideoxygalactose transaminase